MFYLAAFADEAGSALSAQIDAMRRNDIPYLEIRSVDGTNVSDLTVEEAKEIRRTLDDAGIRVWAVGSPIGKIDIRDPFGPHLDKFKHTLDLSEVLGARHIRLFSFYHKDIPVSDTLRDSVLERLSAFCEAAKGREPLLCHENEKGIYGDVAERCAIIHRALPKIRAVYDPANYAVCGEDTYSAFETVMPYLSYMHIKDVAGDGTVVPAGKGICRIHELLTGYREIAGTVLTLEPHLTVFDGLSSLEQAGDETKIDAYRYPSPDAAFDAAVAALRTCMAPF